MSRTRGAGASASYVAHPWGRRFRLPPDMPRSVRDFGGFRRDGLPLAAAVRKNVHPDVLAAAVLAFVRALFGIAARDHGGIPQYLDLHLAQRDGLERGRSRFQVRQSLSLCYGLAIELDGGPIVRDDAVQSRGVLFQAGLGPVAFHLHQGL